VKVKNASRSESSVHFFTARRAGKKMKASAIQMLQIADTSNLMAQA
jgi:hypothetical protein